MSNKTSEWTNTTKLETYSQDEIDEFENEILEDEQRDADESSNSNDEE